MMSRHDGIVRLLAVAFGRYTRRPEDRAPAAAMMLMNAMRLHAAETSPLETATLAGQILHELEANR